MGSIGKQLGILPPSPNTDFANASQGQVNAIQQLMNIGQGQGPTYGQIMTQQGLQQANAGALGTAAAQRGISPGLSAQMANRQQGQLQQQALLGGSAMAAQERQNALQASLGASAQQQQLQGQASQEQNQANMAGSQALGGILGGAAGGLGTYAGLSNFGHGLGGSGGGGMGSLSIGGSPNAGAGTGYLGANNSFTPGFSDGGQVPGRPKTFGDSQENDTVPAMLSPGELVIPRSHASDPKKAHAFVDHLMKKKNKATYADVVAARKKRG